MTTVSTINDIFSEQAKATPENIALVHNDKAVTYLELEEKSNQLAHYLRTKGVKEDTLVPVFINRSIEMIIGLMGILKAGGAYVPIDPEYPRDRIEYILEDTKSNLLITDYSSAQLIKDFAFDGEVINLQTDWLKISDQPLSAPITDLKPNNLAYIIYTSGSTGNPKGVMIEHHNVVRLFFTDQPLFDFKETDVWTMFHSFCFDFSVWEMYGALLFGGKLIIVPKETAKNAQAFGNLLIKEKVTILNQTPSAFYILQDYILNQAYVDLRLRYIIYGGEALNPSKLKTWKNRFEHCKLINMYGITETTVHVTFIEITNEHCENSKSVIGSPIPTLYAYVLNDAQEKTKLDEEGELYIGGEGLARGYLNLPELTAYRFIQDHFSNDVNARLYRTGDLAKQMPDGSFEYLGRIDDQVKINGYRIELGEIETNINHFAGVEQTVVLAKESFFGEKKLVAYIKTSNKIDQQLLIKFLQKKMPDYMVPRIFIKMDEIPLTSNGKADKKALNKIKISRPDLTTIYKKPKTETEENLYSVWNEFLEIEKIGVHDNFFELGGNSLLAQRTTAELKHKYDYKLGVTKLYQYPTIADLAKFIDKTSANNKAKTIKTSASSTSSDIAVIGMSGRFPGAETMEEFWDLILQGKETTTFFKPSEIDENIPENIKNDPSYVKARGIIKDATQFDPAFFGINPKLAELMDPQQRVFLEIAWETLEKTGHLPTKYSNKVGVFSGFGTNTYYENNVLSHLDKIENQGKIQVLSVNEKDYAASRTAYHLNLKGPAVSINSACSTSLLAITQAVNSLRAGQCAIALAGGASITSPINSGHIYQEGSMLSEDGHCKPFDDSATGTVFSDGAGVVLLKRLDEAEQDGDTIFAVIKGVGINNDGLGKGSFTAPSTEGQSDAIACAIQDAGINASEISYVEAHGTGTPIGDPIEFEGLVDAFGDQEKKQYCAIGSVKSNFGHLTQAAGVAGLIKTCFALYYKKLPASLGYSIPNRNIDFENSPFFVNSTLTEWETENKRIAGVSSFGVGGTNVHIILKEYENEFQESAPEHKQTLITWSANSEASRENYALVLAKLVQSDREVKLADLAYTLNKSRVDFRYRRFVVASSKEELLETLDKAPSTQANLLTETPSEIVFMFPGQGAQYLNMGLQLYNTEPVYKTAVDECAEILLKYINQDIREIIFPKEVSDEASDKLKDTRWTQPALFVTEYALAKLWISFGVEPTLFCGHSIGEYVSAHLAGIFSLEDGLKLISTRGSLISDLPNGDMLSVRESADIVSTYLKDDLSIAAVNSPKLVVVAGPKEQIATLSKTLDESEIVNKLLFTSHAFHSSMMDPILDEFKAVVLSVNLYPPKIPIISTVTGQILTDEEALDPMYWTLHLRKPVMFAKAIEYILENSSPIFLEVGPGNVTATLTKQIAAGLSKSSKAISSISANQDEYGSILKSLGQLWMYGAEPNLDRPFENDKRVFINLPTYQFDRKKYWVDILGKKIETTNQTIHYTDLTNQDTILSTHIMRKDNLTAKVKQVLEDASGIEMDGIKLDENFLEIGLDSLLLTQVAISLKKVFGLPITFRKLNEEYSTIETLVEYLDQNTPQDAVQEIQNYSAPTNHVAQQIQLTVPHLNGHAPTQTSDSALGLIAQQLEILSKQVMLMQGQAPSSAQKQQVNFTPSVSKPTQEVKTNDSDLSVEERAEIQKPFGATPKIEKQSSTLNPKQEKFLKDLTERYNKKTFKSKQYTSESRSYMADPRVVTGFRPATKELVYPIVINKSKGSKMWDLDENEYIDVLNGFGSNMLGYQPDVIKEAMHDQIEKGYEVGPQHELAAEVSKLICEFTDFDRAALCSTGSEAVLGCVRIARTVTGRSLIVAFTGSYHGIVDEVLVRGTKKLKSFPAAAGIMPESVQNILVLDYGTDEALAIIKEREDEIAAVLVEPIQSRRPEFVPIDFLKEVRAVTEKSGAVLIFDEVITGFRFHPGGAQAIFGIKADLASYGKVVGAGTPIGVIAGKSYLMDALDGGNWNYGDASYPEVGVTYFAGTFVRHPLALASAKASLTYMKQRGPTLQQELNEKGEYISGLINEEFEKRQLPIFVANYGSLWKIKYQEEIPYSELLFVLLREKGIHILDGFPCFITEATSYQDIEKVVESFRESLNEMTEAGFFPEINQINKSFDPASVVLSADNPPVKGAKLGKDKEGNPAWFIADPHKEGKYLQVATN
ncbi:polyketide synthase [Pedobacter fastidiosus]|uniref:Amino acid adenylation domain-containing protein n=1 Tax=Pedobacter fastidiosus TaxID=2765361 RepID=A0ABR7KVK7_9SPHI|nr:polyketide synthase [Pedobacter fastidiosus]MBC6112097.1 amino acid adenylation domain-containing protein [Pedobacter fastidiosus]